jgi:hypothetical protein
MFTRQEISDILDSLDSEQAMIEHAVTSLCLEQSNGVIALEARKDRICALKGKMRAMYQSAIDA